MTSREEFKEHLRHLLSLNDTCATKYWECPDDEDEYHKFYYKFVNLYAPKDEEHVN